MHGVQDIPVLALPQIIVGAPNRDVLLPAIVMPRRLGKIACMTLQLREYTVTPFIAKVSYAVGK
jgi:hypothetical protein